jgi:hypothetical protein
MHSAAEQVLMSIDELLVANDDKLVVPMTTLNKATSSVFQKNTKIITQLQQKILKAADLETTKHLDALDGVYTTVLQGLDTWQFDVNFLLTQLAAKGGFTEAGQSLEHALEKELSEAPQLAYQGTLVLAVAEAIPYLNQLIEVLREIRDRMPPNAMRVAGEVPAKSAMPDEPVIDTDRSEWIEPSESPLQ